MYAQTSGDVLPVLMNPCSLPQSLPLAEEICSAISDMNADQMMVTQKTLVEQLVKSYPGIAVPSHKILYNILGALIKERKIYHTENGYFIVTPNTYFIANDAPEDNKRVLLEDSCCSLSSISYLVNAESCADPAKENIPTVSCYRSCHCFSDQNMLTDQRYQQLMNLEANRGGKKGRSELKPSIQTQVISASAENHSWDTIKSLTSVKEKLKCKKFGLGLFWRGTSKKEKQKKEFSTFSAQFPPKEWPVRDEDNLDNMPRDIEHEIIKRINPTLTVDNLIKHTKLMQKFEERKKSISEGISAEALTLRQKHLSKECVPKTQIRTAKHCRKTKSDKEKQISRSNRKSHMPELTSPNQKLEENISLSTMTHQPLDVAVESHVIYKKQIKNPFQGLSWRHNVYSKGYRGRVNSHLKPRTQKRERGSQRLHFLDSSKAFEYETEQQVSEMQADNVKQSKFLQTNRSSVQLKKDSLSENCSYPQSSTLRIDDKSKYFVESVISEDNVYRGTVERNHGDIQKSPHSSAGDNGTCKEAAKHSLHLKESHCRYKADTVCELLDQTANEFRNVSLSHYTTNVSRVKEFGVKHRQKTDEKNDLIFKYVCASHPGSMKVESEGFIDKGCLQYQKAHPCDTGSLLHLGDNSECNEPCHLVPGCASSGTTDWNKAVQKMGTALKNSKVNICSTQYNTTVNKHGSGDHGYKGCAGFAESIDGSKKHQNPDFIVESCLCSQVLPTVYREEDETGLTEHVKASAVADFCSTNEDDSLRETGEVVLSRALGPQTKETRNPLVKKGLFFKNACTVLSGQNHTEGTENHSITGDSGIDSPRWTEKKMKFPAKS
ncbi:storkhead-box protein 1 isoform X1 [Cygnus olor]|uniref:storkhead-box protein 1 isoform X1 n=2 Tax=Cygnus olor TaxID=8869 RepID=UPI001ADE581F|nr:storkhead-box protein 1 isoform X1 [Cygnus olor]